MNSSVNLVYGVPMSLLTHVCPFHVYYHTCFVPYEMFLANDFPMLKLFLYAWQCVKFPLKIPCYYHIFPFLVKKFPPLTFPSCFSPWNSIEFSIFADKDNNSICLSVCPLCSKNHVRNWNIWAEWWPFIIYKGWGTEELTSLTDLQRWILQGKMKVFQRRLTEALRRKKMTNPLCILAEASLKDHGTH